MKFTYLALAASIILTSCGMNSETNDQVELNTAKIMHGEALELNDPVLSYTVALTKKEDLKTSFCTGSLISDRHIITAEHCLSAYGHNIVNIAFVSKDTKYFKIKKVHSALTEVKKMYPFDDKYKVDFGVNFDIAVVEIDGVAPQGHKPIEILDAKFTDQVKGSDIQLAGFGITESTKTGNPRKVDLKALDVKTTTLERSTLLYKSYSKKGACNGDSGGPATIELDSKTYLIGSTHGYTKAAFNKEEDTSCSSGQGIYTYLPYYKDWIISKINNTDYSTNTFDPFAFAKTNEDNDKVFKCDSIEGLTLQRWYSLYIYATKTVETYNCEEVVNWFQSNDIFVETPTSKADIMLGKWRPLGNYYFLSFFENLKKVTIDQSWRLTANDRRIHGIDLKRMYLSNKISEISAVSDMVDKVTLKGGTLAAFEKEILEENVELNLLEVDIK